MVVFEDVLEHMLLQSPNKHFLDSYAIRHLTFTPPASAQVLSGLMLGPNKYVQRMEVTSHAGETAILTFTMTSTTPPPLPPAAPASLPEPGTAAAAIAAASVPADQAAAAPAPPPPEPEPVWRLRSVRGEPAYSSMLPEGPSPELSPEQVVEAQLHALQNRDPVTAFRFFSAGSQKILGSEDKFGESLKKNRRYGAMLGHMAATSVRRCMVRATTYMEVVAVTSASGTRFVFLYILSQEPTGPHGGGGWHIETVKVVDDKKLLEAVESSCAQQRAAAQDDE